MYNNKWPATRRPAFSRNEKNIEHRKENDSASMKDGSRTVLF